MNSTNELNRIDNGDILQDISYGAAKCVEHLLNTLEKHEDDTIVEELERNILDSSQYSSLCTEFPLMKGDEQDDSSKQKTNDINGVKPFMCKFCGNAYSWLKSLRCHSVKHHKKEYRAKPADKAANRGTEFPCQLCSHSYKLSSSLAAHIIGWHKDEDAIHGTEFSCRQCSDNFPKYRSLASHMLRQHSAKKEITDSSKDQFACKYCFKKHHNYDSLRLHCKRYHSHNVTRNQKSSVQKVSSFVTASQEERFKCNECDKVLSNLSNLNRHKLTHSTSCFTCCHCEQVFKQSGLLKKHLENKECEQENGKKSDDISLEGLRLKVNRKRTHENNGLNNNFDDLSTPPVAKRATVKHEPDVVIIEPQFEIDEPFEIKEEPVDMKEYREPTSHNGNIIVAQTYTEDRQIHSLPRIPLSPSICSDFSSISQHGYLNNNPSLINSFVAPSFEKSSFPLSAGIFTQTVQFPNELMIVWSYSLEEDLLAAVSMNKRNSIMCVQELQTLNLPKHQRDLLSKSQMVTFNMLDSNDTFTPWTVIYFREENCPNGLKKKLFRSFAEVENTLSEHAAARGMTINSVMRDGEDGLFPLLSKNLKKKCMVFNFIE